MIRSVAICLLLTFAKPAWAATYTAVIIGNGDYPVAPLPNAQRDARLVADSFRAIGFDVVPFDNVDSVTFPDVLDQIADHLSDADVGVLYFVGHAVQFDGSNYLLPVDLEQLTADELERKRLPLERIVTVAAEGRQQGLRMFLIDACRTDPFSPLDDRIRPGLTLDQFGAAEMLIAYATGPGELASDGPPGGHGPYAVALSRALTQAGLDLDDMMNRVRGQVSEATEQRQVPWIASSVEHDYRLNRSERDRLLESVAGEDVTFDTVLWYFLQSSVSPLDLRRFALFFKDSAYRTAALERLAEVADAAPLPSGSAIPAPDPGPAAALGAPIPADLFRVERERLSEDAFGLDAVARPCDWLTADPADPQRVAPGVRAGLIDLPQAAQACVYELVEDPDNPRFLFQLGRVLQIAERHAWARHFYTEAARRGYSAALTNLGFIYREGMGVEVDYVTALRYYHDAAALGNLRARTSIGGMFLRGEGVESNPAEAVQWYRLASETGWVNAQNALADAYREGIGVPLDTTTAAALYELAALNGQSDAMNNLGRLLLEGDGVPRNRELAHLWLMRGDANGSRGAPFTLARDLIATGAAKDDPERVIDLLRRASRRGNARAWLELALVADEGEIVPRDPEEAYANARRAELEEVPRAAPLAQRLQEELSPETVTAIDAKIEMERRFNGP